MSAEASSWAKWRETPDATSKHLLRELADFADAEGLGWAAMDTLSKITGKSVRQLQRAMRVLEAERLVSWPEGVFHRTRAGQRVPMFQLAFIMPDHCSRGDVDVTPSAARGDADVTPRGDVGVTPRGDVGVTQAKSLELGCSIEHTPEARAQAFERVRIEWVRIDPDRVSRPKAWDAWLEACAGVDPAVIEAAALRYLAESGQVKRHRTPMLHNWLAERNFENWIGDGASPDAPKRTRFADETIRAAAAGAKGEGWTASYLDPVTWDEPARRITPHTRTAVLELRRSLGWLWSKLGVTVADPEPAEGG